MVSDFHRFSDVSGLGQVFSLNLALPPTPLRTTALSSPVRRPVVNRSGSSLPI
ncbi:hypothetical protein ARMGADRAFT_1007570 [Armillaria gallica]|uniref:Uncharacterized protein n=1 Tax=Armillaria gallica TaxID=47427 RepID=A0A2H3DUN7_ARMGA|nr:hypothetical protein ARMGADRAFT_1007570 [Armillaria gallica]